MNVTAKTDLSSLAYKAANVREWIEIIRDMEYLYPNANQALHDRLIGYRNGVVEDFFASGGTTEMIPFSV